MREVYSKKLESGRFHEKPTYRDSVQFSQEII